MSKVLLNYAVEFNEITPTTAASLAFLHQIGVVTKPTETPPGIINDGSEIGSETVPVVLKIAGILTPGAILDARFNTDDGQAVNNYAPLTLLEQTTGDQAAILWADLINGIPGVSATPDGNTVQIKADDGAISVTVQDAGVRYVPQGTTPFIQSENGDVVNGSEMTFVGNYTAGDVFSVDVSSDVPFAETVELTLAADGTAQDVATQLAAAIQAASDLATGGIIATADGVDPLSYHVVLRAEDTVATTVSNTNLTYAPTAVTPAPFVPGIFEVTDPESLMYYTDQWEAIQGVFDGGTNRVYLVLVDDIAEVPLLIGGAECDFYTIYGTLDFPGEEYAGAFAKWEGVRAWTTNVQLTGALYAAQTKTCIFFEDNPLTDEISDYYGLFSFGSLLAAATWRNQQYIPISPELGNPVTELGKAESLFDDRLSFYLNDTEQGTRLAFFVAGGKSITTPYINEELKVLMQSDMLNFLSANQPFNIETSRRQLEQVGNKRIAEYVDSGLLDPDGTNDITITNSNEQFIVNGDMETTESVALWRVRVDALQQVGL